ncbi:MAG: hypothetical protein PVF68_10285 [Acidobacteriota bacterium]|jgi:hypothetical protein
MRGKGIRWMIGGAGVVVLSLGMAAGATGLENLKCIDATFTLQGEHPLSENQGLAFLKSELRSKIPGLPIDKKCFPTPDLSITVISVPTTSQTGVQTGYAFVTEIGLKRLLLDEDSKEYVLAEVWGTSKLSLTPPELASDKLREKVQELITEFASEYRDAGNP